VQARRRPNALGPTCSARPSTGLRPTRKLATRAADWLPSLSVGQRIDLTDGFGISEVSVGQLDLRDDTIGSHPHQHLARSCVSTTKLFRAIVTHIACGDPDRPRQQLVLIIG
jgi:hypothetical protein